MTASNYSKIRVLSDHTINQIAAGEVIENPASVVKELVENSIDACADSITVEIISGGRQLIRISDNGCGMSPDDAVLCLERHATSKIRSVDDIEALISMGFRGEAIPSIASISKFTLLTTPKLDETDSQEGTLVIVEGGRLVSVAPAIRSPGTTIEVKSLFYNVPVRRKFQRSPTYDAQEIHKILSSLALGNPHIQFELVSDQKTVFKTSRSKKDSVFLEQLKCRIADVLGGEVEKTFAPLYFSHEGYQLQGFIGRPSEHRPNRTGQFLFINRRSVASSLISNAIREGYGSMLPANRYPVFIMHLSLPGELVDVNVHPQKKEVRLRQESMLRGLIAKGVQSAFGMTFSAPASIDSEGLPPAAPSGDSPSAFYESLLYPAFKQKIAPPVEGDWEYRPVVASKEPIVPPQPLSFSQEPVKFASPIRQQVSSTPAIPQTQEVEIPLFEIKSPVVKIETTIAGFLVLKHPPDSLNAENETGLCLVDQRAAYARICYEKLMGQAQGPSQQMLLIPQTFSLSSYEASLLRDILGELERLEFSIREIGEGSFLIDGYPIGINERELIPCLNQLIYELRDGVSRNKLQEKREAYFAWAACKASLPTTRKMTIEEGERLVEQLLSCKHPFLCPLGKPTIVHLTTKELSKLFN